jgi:addiction module HigA family antidote
MMKLKPLHPGEVLREEYLGPLDLSAGQLAKALYVPRRHVERLVAERIELSVDMALRLAKYFGNSPEFWLTLKGRHEREKAEEALGPTLARIERRAS